MKRPGLDLIRAAIKARMQAGEDMHYVTVWQAAESASRNWARDTLRLWHKAGEIHICGWRQHLQGPPSPIYRWGTGKDANKPPRQTCAEKCRKWRANHPEKSAADRKRSAARNRKTPILDPIHAAMLGYKKHGKNAWIKPNDKEPAHTNNEAA